MENNYVKYEADGRTLFNNWCFNNSEPIAELQFEANQYSRTDCTFFSGSNFQHRVVAEIKTREHNHNTSFNGTPAGWIYEKGKHDKMINNIKAGINTAAYYINIFPDAIVVWNVTELNPTWTRKLCFENHKRENKVMKDVCYLPLSAASHIYKCKLNLTPRV